MVVIGPILGPHPSQIGGTTKSFDTLLRFLRNRNIDFKVVATNRFRLPFAAIAINAVYVLARCLFVIPRAESVMLNVSPKGALVLGPPLILYAKLWRKHFFFRMFGGDLIEVYESQTSSVQRLLQKTIFQADLVLLQTRKLVNYFSRHCQYVQLLPTSRDAHSIARINRKYNRRFIYIGLICKEKGVEHILRFQQEHGNDYRIDLYGPILDPQFQNIASSPNYKGVIAPDDVINVLANYDVLLLPTFYPGEGYPGVIIEANSVGLPVISTHWLAIPELVIDGKTGLLVTPDNYPELARAILRVDDRMFQHLSNAARQWSRRFESNKVYSDMFFQITQLQANAK